MLKLIAACKKCKQQYDATGRESGSLFHCYCGEVVTVPSPTKTSLEMNVVRCSSCGAAREGAAKACNYCKSDFTLHELDLNTICPTCTTRISSKGKFCHSCGTRVSAQTTAGEITDKNCPSCEPANKMHGRQLGEQNISVLECDTCAGLWLHHDCFNALQGSVMQMGAEALQKLEKFNAPETKDLTRKFKYRKCPHCADLMARKNFGGRSGIILDVCPSHGLWFEQDELARVLAWIRKGGLLQANREELDDLKRKRREIDVAGMPTYYEPPRDKDLESIERLANSMLNLLFKK